MSKLKAKHHLYYADYHGEGTSSGRFFGGTTLCCHSLSNGDVKQGKLRFYSKGKLDASSKIWEKAAMFGV